MGWLVEERRATLKTNSYQCTFDLARPYLGLELRDPNEKTLVEQLFAHHVTDPTETVVRGVDLICRYAPRIGDQVSYHTYYRAKPEYEGLELILSAQTSLLESAPLTQVTTAFSAGEILVCTAGTCTPVMQNVDLNFETQPDFFLIRPVESESVSLLLFTRPSDFHRATVSVGAPSIAFWVFPDSLEKGVIRRATFQLSLISRSNDEVSAIGIWQQVAFAAPPLAT